MRPSGQGTESRLAAVASQGKSTGRAAQGWLTRLAIVAVLLGPAVSSAAAQSTQAGNDVLTLLTPADATIILLDHQPTVTFAVQSMDRTALGSNTVGLAKAARAFGARTILTTIQAESFSGPIYPEVQAQFPTQAPIDRTSRNAWSDPAFVSAVEATDRRKLVMAGLWTEVYLAFTTLNALEAGYEVYIVVHASGGISEVAHDAAVARMAAAGAIPVTWQQVMLEFAEAGTSPEAGAQLGQIIGQHSGVLGLNALYAASRNWSQR